MVLAGKACQTNGAQVELLATMSRQVGALRAGASRGAKEPSREEVAAVPGRMLRYLDEFVRDHAVQQSALVGPVEQMYQTGDAEVRAGMVTAFASTAGTAASQALARRAVFDPSPAVRERAVEALKNRDRGEARDVLLAALRHPWAPAADHAALALAALGDAGALPRLRTMLGEPDPSRPFEEGGGKWVRRELVRVNHLGNRLLCHAPSVRNDDPVRGQVPTRGEPLPAVSYDRNAKGLAVRADVVYFRPDFSAWHSVQEPKRWPKYQRFDYLVRLRELTSEEAERAKGAAQGKTYPQREAARWALAQLEGKEPRR